MSESRHTSTATSASTSAAVEPPSLRGYLAARHAQASVASAASRGAGRTPQAPAHDPLDHAALAEAAQAVAQVTLPPGKLALLATSLAGYDVAAAARRLTSTQALALLSASPAQARRQPAPVADDGLTIAALDALTPDAWADFIRWLLEQEGARIEPRPFSQHEGLMAWRAEQGERRLVICAWRLEAGWPLLEEDLRRMAALAACEPGTQLVIVSTAEATAGARLAGQSLGGDVAVRFLDRPALAQTLAGLSTAYERERLHAQDVAAARAKAGASARKKLLAALTALDEQAQTPVSAQRAAGRVAVRKAASQVEQARRLASQALIAWETLLAEWSAAFGERPARDGALLLSAEPPVYAALAERADHLKKPLLDALRTLAKTPGDGDLGYAPWRIAIGEELAARCAALRWRAQWIDPAQWQDYAAAVNDFALQEATRAENAARHAAARAERARSQLVERVGAL